MNEYFYGVRIFPGQDPSSVYLGWVTTQYHLHSADFSHDQVRVATVQKLDSYGGVQESVDRLSCYMVRADELYGEVSTRASQNFRSYLPHSGLQSEWSTILVAVSEG